MKKLFLTKEPSQGKLWLLFFLYSCFVAFCVQLIILPKIFITWHAGDGLLVGGDWVYFQQLALDLVQKIKSNGWSVWELRPEGQAPAGIAAAIYFLTGISKPWTIIPLNAALHATGGLLLLKILKLFNAKWPWALWGTMPYLLFPSAMLWFTQLHKDGYFITGSLFLVYGFMSMVRYLIDSNNNGKIVLESIVCLAMGTFLIWTVRPYALLLIQAVWIFKLIIMIGFMLIRSNSYGFPGRKAVNFLVINIILLVTFSNIAVSPINTSKVDSMPWQYVNWLPDFIESKIYGLSLSRKNYIDIYPDAASSIDTHICFYSIYDIIKYTPRAFEIALFAPFPQDWLTEGSHNSTTMMRKFAGAEMIVVYFSLLFFPVFFWYRRKRIEPYLIAVFALGMMYIYSLSTPNVGTLYRVRYGYLMLLVAMGLQGLGYLIDKRKSNKAAKI